ncbi:hypothetical protein [Paenibacillus jilunlii]|uniref:Uncharacterized protein n=1 Tax=Paenibacillus jilunlii TaxID=682956 RepID=A0A1H0A5T3_9BACL|nr:hypothetical protein [Paenibacillus jilunlii]KWX79953.1 hypothetical protein AML91_01940 [Paenibacillus jilunlii]SDN28096.1 hypothetical protein SAMN05216191_13450 [Paenibacillus jilunlii]
MEVKYLFTMGGKSAAANNYNNHPKMEIFTLSIDKGDIKMETHMNLEDMENLAQEMMEYVQEVKEHAAVLIEMGKV